MQRCGREGWLEGFRAQAGGSLVPRRRSEDLHSPEAALVVEDEAPPIPEAQTHRRMCGAFPVGWGCRIREQAPGHAEVHGHYALVIEAEENVLGPSLDCCDGASAHVSGEPAWGLAEHIGVRYLDADDATAYDRGPQATDDGLRFRQLGHRIRSAPKRRTDRHMPPPAGPCDHQESCPRPRSRQPMSLRKKAPSK